MASDGGVDGAVDGEEMWGGAAARSFAEYELPQNQLQIAPPASSPAVVDGDRSSYGGTWKSRAVRRIVKKSAPVPYERPAVGRHAAAGPQAAAIIGVTSAQALAAKRRGDGGGAWLGSGISKIITTGASYLYSSIFRRQLAAPVQVSDFEVQQLDSHQRISLPSGEVDENQREIGQVGFRRNHEQYEPEVATTSPSDEERLFGQKTLSRDEYEHLTALLQSRVVNNGVERKQQPKHVEFDGREDGQEVYPSSDNQFEAQRWRQDLQKSRKERETTIRALSVYGNGELLSTTSAGPTETLDALSSSPVEVARAFMGGRASLQSRTSPGEPLHQRDENLLSIEPAPPLHASEASLVKWSGPPFVKADQFHTPPPLPVNSWGRNRMPLRTPLSRAPYSRPLHVQPPREGAVDGALGTPTTRWNPIGTPLTGGREMLKRRSTVLDDGWSSGGPIRRTKHKGIVSASPATFSQSRGSSFPMTPLPGTSRLTLPSPVGGKPAGPKPLRTNLDVSPSKTKDALSTSYSLYVPAQSSETARKILATLEKMTPSPQGKSLGDELALVRSRPPATLTDGMLNERACKSMAVAEHPGSIDSFEPSPAGTSMDNEPPSFGYPGSTSKTSESSGKVKGKGKASQPSTGNGSGGQGGLQSAQERASIAPASFKQISSRSKKMGAVLTSEADEGKGFRMSAVFEESGSEDDGHGFNAGRSTSLLPSSTSKLSSTSSKSTTVTSSIVGTATPSTTSSTVGGLFGVPIIAPAIDTSKTAMSGFTFPTRGLVEGPPTPRAMSPASPSPKVSSSTLFSQGAELLPISGSATEQSRDLVKGDPQMEIKADDFSGSPSAQMTAVTQPAPKFQSTLDYKVPNIFEQSSAFFGASSSSAATLTLATVTSAGASSSSMAGFGPASPSLKSWDTLPTNPGNDPLKFGATVSYASSFLPSSSSSLFSSGISSVQIASGTVPSRNLFASSGSGTAPAKHLSIGSSGTETSLSLPPGTSTFAQSNPFVFKNSSTRPSSDSLASPADDDSTALLNPERPQKRSALPLQDNASKQQQASAAVPSNPFTTFGSSVGNSSATPTISTSFAAPNSNTTTPQVLFPASSFGQASSSSQMSSGLPSATASPFTFGSPASSTETTPAVSSATFSSTPSFSSFPNSVFGTASIGSTFGVTSATPMAFGSSASSIPAFGAASSNTVFGGFVSDSVSQSPSTPVFGSGFTSPSPSPAFAFGASAPAFSFVTGAASPTSGTAFNFGSSGSFPFVANESVPPLQRPSIFGPSSSGSAFGSTANGTMVSDVIVNDQLTMDDNSMAEEPSQLGGTVMPQPSVFGAQSSAAAGSFVFGAQTGALGGGGSSLFPAFLPQSNPAGFAAAANSFAAPQPPVGSLDFSGGSFTLGSGGDKPQRKFIKAKRTGAKRGK